MTHTIELPYSKTIQPATYKQITFIDSFDNFSYSKVISNTQLMKRLDSSTAFEIISVLKEGAKVILLTEY
jgi:hypothetical protein